MKTSSVRIGRRFAGIIFLSASLVHAEVPTTIDFAGAPVTVLTEGANVSATITSEGVKQLELSFTAGEEYPGVRFVMAGARDLSAHAGVEAEITNTGGVACKVGLRVDNEGDWQAEPGNSEIDEIASGETKTIAVTFGQSYGAPGFKLDASKVIGVLVYGASPKQTATLRLRRLAPFGGTSPAPVVVQPRPAAPTVKHTLVWSDEFDLTGPPDPVKWDYETGPHLRNNEASHYTRRIENVRVQKGNLVIEARREHFEGSAYTSGSLTTRTTFPFVYGRVEIRAKLPRGRGIWPALWLLGWHNEKAWWPETGEIDLMEHVGCEPDLLFFSIHTLENNHAKSRPIQARLPVSGIYDDYHLYRLDWTDKTVTLFFDDKEVLHYEKTGDKMASWPFSNPMYLIMNVAIGGNWGGSKGIDDTIFPQRLLIDYVRIYKTRP
ncbi:MAG: glycoside hydrolase [Rariglobus sp.]|jgi:beta-glucanase (GH16 family)|nr:glycoside hydrolase [Rariglobus sp.]